MELWEQPSPLGLAELLAGLGAPCPEVHPAFPGGFLEKPQLDSLPSPHSGTC